MFTNLPPDLQRYFQAITDRLDRLERMQRFTAPNVNVTASPPPYPRIGDIYFDTDGTNPMLRYWGGTGQWVEVADNLHAPTLNAVSPTLAATGLTYTGSPVTVEYQQIGHSILANAFINCATVTNFGTGQWSFTMPAGFPTRAHDLVAGGYLNKGGTIYTLFGSLAASSSTMYLWVPTSNGGSSIFDYNSPTTLDTTCQINITGIALLA